MTSTASRTVLVTGAAGGMCRGITARLADAGYALVCVDVDAERIAAVAEELRARGAVAQARAIDLRDSAAAVELAADLEREGVLVEAIVNAAGVLDRSSVHELARETLDRVLAINLTAAVDVIRAFLPGMVDRGWGRVVNITSIAASHGYPYAAYAASKAGLKHFGMAMVRDLRGTGVTVNAISPGVVDTPMISEAARERVTRKVPTGALISPEEIGDAVVYLLSDSARSITGADLVIDGGATQLVAVLED